MKPIYHRFNFEGGTSFGIRKVAESFFYNRWHYHPELEISWVQEGTGTRLVGDHVEPFKAGELVVLGANLPHLWRSDDRYFLADNTDMCSSLAIHFTEDFAGKEFGNLPETRPLRDFFARAGRGLKFFGDTRDRVQRKMAEMADSDDFSRLVGLLDVLRILTFSREYVPLASIGYAPPHALNDTERLARIYHYTFAHYSGKISLEEIAAEAALNPPSFCRYFKSKVRKTYTQFLSEVRIGQACKLLISGDLPVAQVCFESGYTNFSHFNRHFKKITGLTPVEYRRAYQKG
ncbi:AraC family transcriptional regulator [Siphonobacter aquaeclarae]|jgi:AraC-like DNA-binding protein|uniref:Transcriptional regulator, AraC family n=1 Tax=Siphonobacter aquaeclarae TaxID=563176 RepID=A0A1G9YRH1_9BACT|nr:AraC family transcriptional regulator [Siphonobacter aquaeclarae]MBO9638698.1 AraC family transcriptional regulator [Siphonobacter aquaeclarae]SDN11789.1 transcriptional regulator, AraC family [Siphonobacter aquaeclarae]